MRMFERLQSLRRFTPVTLLSLLTVIAVVPSAVAARAVDRDSGGREFWQRVPGKPAIASSAGAEAAVRPKRFQTFTLNRSGLASLIAGAPFERTRAARERTLVLALPSPSGGFQRFAIQESPVMEPGLAAKHPEIKTYSGRGIDDPRLTGRFDMTPLGFHSSVRGPGGSWYIDPYYAHDQSLYVSYYGRDLPADPAGTFVENGGAPGISSSRGYYGPAESVELSGYGFSANAPITIAISDPANVFAARTVFATSDDGGVFTATFEADPQSNFGTHQVDATNGDEAASVTYDVVDPDLQVQDPPVGDHLRTYRLALVTDPSYATYFGAANVTAAKVTLINRVTHVYETETSIHLVLIANNDVLNLDTAAVATGANGPCGGAPCFSAAQLSTCAGGTLTRNRQVVGLLVGASNFDVGHIALGVNGGGVASLGVVGLNGKAQGCTGLPKPEGDFMAVDYVAHEMGHEFAGNHTFNGTQSNCSGGNRSAGASVEPGSGSSIMAYAGICLTDNLQPHSDPYWSQRSFDEIVAHTSAAEQSINEVQMGALTGFDGTDSFQLQYNGANSPVITRGGNYTAAGVGTAIAAIPGFPAGTITVTTGAANFTDNFFTVTFSGTLAGINLDELKIVNCTGCTGYIGEIAKGGVTTRRGTVTDTGDNPPSVTVPAGYTIPIQTPFSLTGSATDADGDPLTYMWEQNDRGAAAGTGLMSNTKLNGPLFRQFGVAAIVSATDTLLYESPGENHVTSNPSRVFPDMVQVLANNTNAETGLCPPPAVPAAPTFKEIECFSEYLPTSAYAGFGANAAPARLNFRLTARDGRGGVNAAQTTLTLASAAGPFLVTSPNTAVAYHAGSSQTIAWNVANTNAAPVSTASVAITLSTDGGQTFPYVLAAATPNDGSEPVSIPDVATTHARVKIEAVGNIFFDVSNSDFTIQALPVVTNNAPAGGAIVQYSDAVPAVTVSASDADSAGASLTAAATGLPAGLSLVAASNSGSSSLPGTATWTVVGNASAAPGTYAVTVTVTDETGGSSSTSFNIVVNREDAEVTYTGDMLAFTAPGGSSATVLLRATVRDSSVVPGSGDTAPGNITLATVTFKEGATTLCGPIAVAPIGGDTTTGTASCSVSLGLDAHTITVQVNSYYNGTTTGVVEVAQPDGTFITGGGYSVSTVSAGPYRADANSKIHAAFNVKYNKNGKNLQGQVNITFQSGGKNYQIKSTAMDSLGIALKTSSGGACTGSPSATCFGLADFRSKANLTNTDTGVSVGGGLSLQMTLTDKGEPGANDSIGITLWNGNTLVFSSRWTGTQTVEQLLAGGNTVVH